MLAEEGAVAAAAEKQQIVRPEAAAAAVASTAAKDASGEGGEAVAAGPAGVQPDSPAPGCDVVAVKGTVPFIVCKAGLSFAHVHASIQYVLLIFIVCFPPLSIVKQVHVAKHGTRGVRHVQVAW